VTLTGSNPLVSFSAVAMVRVRVTKLIVFAVVHEWIDNPPIYRQLSVGFDAWQEWFSRNSRAVLIAANDPKT